MTQAGVSQKAVLDRFLADNPELEDLSARLETFNVFRALRVEKVEIRHSNVLGWLLDPEESHGLGDVVLRRVLSNILLENDTQAAKISAAQVELMDFSDVEVRREWRNIDVLAIDRVNKLVLLIENKIKGGESAGQLQRYLDLARREFPQFALVPVFLTLTGEDCSEEVADQYHGYSHVQLLAVLERVFEQRKHQVAEEVAAFLSQYLDTLRRLAMRDETLAELCKKIYRKHREAIDLIVEYGTVSICPQVAEEVLREEGEYEILASLSRTLWFLPSMWSKLIPANGTVWKAFSRPVSVAGFFDFHHNKVWLLFELTRMDDAKLRLDCAQALDRAGFKLSKKAFDENATYSRFLSYSAGVDDLDNEDEVREAVKDLLRKAKGRFAAAGEVFEAVFK
jgi:hypothetical protein